MNHIRLTRAALAVLAAVALSAAGYFAGARFGAHVDVAHRAHAMNTTNAVDGADAKPGRKVLYWRDPIDRKSVV